MTAPARTLAAAAAALLLGAAGGAAFLALPGGEAGIGFDDLRYSGELRRLIVPAGRTGALDLVDPETGAVESIAGFGRAEGPTRGHEIGTTSADEGQGLVFAIDRTRRVLALVDPRARRIVAEQELAGGPDYVRWVGAAGEVWVTEPARQSIEIFRLRRGPPLALERSGEIAAPGGPESLVVDGRRAYTNTFRDATLAIDVPSRAVVARWRNGCRGARGLALDHARGYLFVGCEEGRVVSLDLARAGRVAGEARAGKGVDGIAYQPRLRHLYVPAAEGGSLAVIAADARGALAALGTLDAVPEAHCAAADDRGNVYVCDPRRGRLLVLRDPYPASPRGAQTDARPLPRVRSWRSTPGLAPP